MQGKINEATAEQFAKIIEQYSQDNVFWSFVGSFAATVGFNLASQDAERGARLVVECERQYAYLRGEHPEYFMKLYSQTDPLHRGYELVAGLGVVANLPAQHFAKNDFLGYVFRTTLAAKAAAKAEEARKAEEEAIAVAAAAAKQKVRAGFRIPEDAFAIPAAPMSAEELAQLAQAFYAQCKGRLVKVYDHMPVGGDDPNYVRAKGVFSGYDVAIVDEGGEDEVGVTLENGKLAESTWPIVMLTGPNRGKKAHVSAPDFSFEGTVNENDVKLEFISGHILRARFTDEELIELVRLDMVDYSERVIDVIEATAYIGQTDRQELVYFDPPLPSIMHPFDPPNGDFSSAYRIDDWSQRDKIKVIDVYLDFESTEERADAYRSMWAHGVSYTSHGFVELGHSPILPFMPTFIRKRPGADLTNAPALDACTP